MYKDGLESSLTSIDTSKQADEQPNAQPNAQAGELANEHIITKLNVFFNFIINNKSSTQKINIPLEDKENLIMFYRKLDIYIDNPYILEIIPEEKIFEYKLLYWAIKEIYYSPQRLFLDSLTKEQMYLRYYKTKKYMDLDQCSIDEFSAYFITCLNEEMEVGKKINDRKSLRNGGF